MADRQDRSLTARPFDDSLPPANNALWGAACFPFIVTNCRRREINENPLCTQKYPAPYKNRGLIIVRPMKLLVRFLFLVVVAATILSDSTSLVVAEEPPPSAPGNRREVIEVLRQWGVFDRKPHILYIGPLTSQSWVVVLKFPDGASEKYSVNMVTKDCSKICHH